MMLENFRGFYKMDNASINLGARMKLQILFIFILLLYLDIAACNTTVQSENICKLKTNSLSCQLNNNNDIYNNLYNNTSIVNINKFQIKCYKLFHIDKNLFKIAFHNLNDLTIDNCIINLNYLVNLNLQTLKIINSIIDNLLINNSSIITTNNMLNLVNLDLSINNLKFIPKNLFCYLKTIRKLNLTKNNINEINYSVKAPTGPECFNNIEILNLNNNKIDKINDREFYYFNKLTQLLLSYNKIVELDENSFTNLINLNELNLSNNLIKFIPNFIFKNLLKLRKLYLNNNFLKNLPTQLFLNLFNLEYLNLSNNHIELAQNDNIFVNLNNLLTLNLGYNLLKKFQQSGMKNLKNLILEFNKINFIDLHDLENLKNLILTNNHIKYVNRNFFVKNFNLELLFLDSNFIDNIDNGTFKSLYKLNELSLNNNKLKFIPNCVNELHSLKSLDLGNNLLNRLSNSYFYNLNELLGLRLAGNFIKIIEKNTFIYLKKLQVLNLASNQINYIERELFHPLKSLQALRLDNNQISDISNGLLTELNSLVWLNISDNKIANFDYAFIPTNLEWLEIYKNYITRINNTVNKSQAIKLTYLNINHNEVNHFDKSTIPNSVKTINLSWNRIIEIPIGVFLNKLNLEKIDLTHNSIKSLNSQALLYNRNKNSQLIPNILLADNPIHCDCTIEWIQKINNILGYLNIQDINAMKCTSMEMKRDRNFKNVMLLKPKEFLCGYTTHCFALCHCCDFDACDCKMMCPDGCSCYYDHIWSTNIVNCGSSMYTHIPDRIPMDSTTIYLDGNNFHELINHSFIGKKKLEIVFLNNSQISILQNRTFYGLSNLKIIHLENNYLNKIYQLHFDQLIELSEIYLDGNHITFVEDDTFSLLNKLQIVSLNYNKLKSIDFITTNSNNNINYNIFDGNYYACNCYSFVKTVNSLKTNNNYELIYCENQNNLKLFIKNNCNNINYDYADNNFANPNSYDIQQLMTNANNDLIGGEYISIIAAILIGIIGTVLFIILLCFLRDKLNFYIHSKYGFRLNKEHADVIEPLTNSETIEQFDGYIFYSEIDKNFILSVLSTDIKQYGYKIGINLNENLLENFITISKRLIIFMSINFLKNWNHNSQFRALLKKLIDSVKPQIRRYKVIVIIAAPLELIMSENYLNNLARSSYVIFLGDKKFWDKLKYAMPDVNDTNSTDTNKHKIRKKLFFNLFNKSNNNKNNNNSSSSSSNNNTASNNHNNNNLTNSPDKTNIEYSYVTFTTSDNQYQHSRMSKTKNHFYSTIGEVNNGRAYFV